MIDLDKLDKKIDKLFENETSDSLTKWLLNKRFGNVNVLLGSGSFESMTTKIQPLFSNKSKAVFNNITNYFDDNPINRQAA